MRIDRQSDICGVSPADLKRLVRRDAFNTLDAAFDLTLDEPALSSTMHDLERSGWIEWTGRDRHVDRWRATDRGLRLCATRLIARFPIREGRKIVQRVVERARAINNDPARSRRISKIHLFGSVLTGNDDDDAGDIDLVVHVERRPLPKSELAALEEAESSTWPRSLRFEESFGRARHDILREIKKLSSKISLHADHDLSATGAPHRIIYSFDVETEREQQADGVILVRQRSTEEDVPRRREPDKTAPSRDYRQSFDRPIAPNMAGEATHLERKNLLHAQVAWFGGASLAEISSYARMPVDAVQTYLAACPREPSILRFNHDLYNAVEGSMIADHTNPLYVEIDVPPDRGPSVRVRALDRESYDRVASVFASSLRDMTFNGRADMFPAIDRAAQAALAWCNRLRTRRAGVGLEASFVAHREREVASASMRLVPDLRPLAQPMLAVLSAKLPPSEDEGSAWGIRVSVELAGRQAIWFGRPISPFERGLRIRQAEVPHLARAIKALIAAHPSMTDHRIAWTIYVDGRQLYRRQHE